MRPILVTGVIGGNYPPPALAFQSGGERRHDGLEGVGAGGEAGGVGHGADVGFALGGPHGAIARW